MQIFHSAEHVKRTAGNSNRIKSKSYNTNKKTDSELTLKTFSTLAIPFPNMVPSWSPIPASKKPKSGIPKMAYKMQKTLPPTVLGATFPYPEEKKNCQVLRTYTWLF